MAKTPRDLLAEYSGLIEGGPSETFYELVPRGKPMPRGMTQADKVELMAIDYRKRLPKEFQPQELPASAWEAGVEPRWKWRSLGRMSIRETLRGKDPREIIPLLGKIGRRKYEKSLAQAMKRMEEALQSGKSPDWKDKILVGKFALRQQYREFRGESIVGKAIPMLASLGTHAAFLYGMTAPTIGVKPPLGVRARPLVRPPVRTPVQKWRSPLANVVGGEPLPFPTPDVFAEVGGPGTPFGDPAMMPRPAIFKTVVQPKPINWGIAPGPRLPWTAQRAASLVAQFGGMKPFVRGPMIARVGQTVAPHMTSPVAVRIAGTTFRAPSYGFAGVIPGEVRPSMVKELEKLIPSIQRQQLPLVATPTTVEPPVEGESIEEMSERISRNLTNLGVYERANMEAIRQAALPHLAPPAPSPSTEVVFGAPVPGEKLPSTDDAGPEILRKAEAVIKNQTLRATSAKANTLLSTLREREKGKPLEWTLDVGLYNRGERDSTIPVDVGFNRAGEVITSTAARTVIKSIANAPHEMAHQAWFAQEKANPELVDRFREAATVFRRYEAKLDEEIENASADRKRALSFLKDLGVTEDAPYPAQELFARLAAAYHNNAEGFEKLIFASQDAAFEAAAIAAMRMVNKPVSLAEMYAPSSVVSRIPEPVAEGEEPKVVTPEQPRVREKTPEEAALGTTQRQGELAQVEGKLKEKSIEYAAAPEEQKAQLRAELNATADRAQLLSGELEQLKQITPQKVEERAAQLIETLQERTGKNLAHELAKEGIAHYEVTEQPSEKIGSVVYMNQQDLERWVKAGDYQTAIQNIIDIPYRPQSLIASPAGERFENINKMRLTIGDQYGLGSEIETEDGVVRILTIPEQDLQGHSNAQAFFNELAAQFSRDMKKADHIDSEVTTFAQSAGLGIDEAEGLQFGIDYPDVDAKVGPQNWEIEPSGLMTMADEPRTVEAGGRTWSHYRIGEREVYILSGEATDIQDDVLAGWLKTYRIPETKMRRGLQGSAWVGVISERAIATLRVDDALSMSEIANRKPLEVNFSQDGQFAVLRDKKGVWGYTTAQVFRVPNKDLEGLLADGIARSITQAINSKEPPIPAARNVIQHLASLWIKAKGTDAGFDDAQRRALLDAASKVSGKQEFVKTSDRFIAQPVLSIQPGKAIRCTINDQIDWVAVFEKSNQPQMYVYDPAKKISPTRSKGKGLGDELVASLNVLDRTPTVEAVSFFKVPLAVATGLNYASAVPAARLNRAIAYLKRTGLPGPFEFAPTANGDLALSFKEQIVGLVPSPYRRDVYNYVLKQMLDENTAVPSQRATMISLNFGAITERSVAAQIEETTGLSGKVQISEETYRGHLQNLERSTTSEQFAQIRDALAEAVGSQFRYSSTPISSEIPFKSFYPILERNGIEIEGNSATATPGRWQQTYRKEWHQAGRQLKNLVLKRFLAWLGDPQVGPLKPNGLFPDYAGMAQRVAYRAKSALGAKDYDMEFMEAHGGTQKPNADKIVPLTQAMPPVDFKEVDIETPDPTKAPKLKMKRVPNDVEFQEHLARVKLLLFHAGMTIEEACRIARVDPNNLNANTTADVLNVLSKHMDGGWLAGRWFEKWFTLPDNVLEHNFAPVIGNAYTKFDKEVGQARDFRINMKTRMAKALKSLSNKEWKQVEAYLAWAEPEMWGEERLSPQQQTLVDLVRETDNYILDRLLALERTLPDDEWELLVGANLTKKDFTAMLAERKRRPSRPPQQGPGADALRTGNLDEIISNVRGSEMRIHLGTLHEDYLAVASTAWKTLVESKVGQIFRGRKAARVRRYLKTDSLRGVTRRRGPGGTDLPGISDIVARLDHKLNALESYARLRAGIGFRQFCRAYGVWGPGKFGVPQELSGFVDRISHSIVDLGGPIGKAVKSIVGPLTRFTLASLLNQVSAFINSTQLTHTLVRYGPRATTQAYWWALEQIVNPKTLGQTLEWLRKSTEGQAGTPFELFPEIASLLEATAGKTSGVIHMGHIFSPDISLKASHLQWLSHVVPGVFMMPFALVEFVNKITTLKAAQLYWNQPRWKAQLQGEALDLDISVPELINLKANQGWRELQFGQSSLHPNRLLWHAKLGRYSQLATFPINTTAMLINWVRRHPLKGAAMLGVYVALDYGMSAGARKLNINPEWSFIDITRGEFGGKLPIGRDIEETLLFPLGPNYDSLLRIAINSVQAAGGDVQAKKRAIAAATQMLTNQIPQWRTVRGMFKTRTGIDPNKAIASLGQNLLRDDPMEARLQWRAIAARGEAFRIDEGDWAEKFKGYIGLPSLRDKMRRELRKRLTLSERKYADKVDQIEEAIAAALSAEGIMGYIEEPDLELAEAAIKRALRLTAKLGRDRNWLAQQVIRTWKSLYGAPAVQEILSRTPETLDTRFRSDRKLALGWYRILNELAKVFDEQHGLSPDEKETWKYIRELAGEE